MRDMDVRDRARAVDEVLSYRDNAWSLRAKAAGYPLCRDCLEPIEKRLWKTSALCGECLRLESDLRIRSRLSRYRDLLG